MHMKDIISALGSNRARYEVRNMATALSFFSCANTPEENARLNASKAALRNWSKYQAACNAIRNSKTVKG